MALIICRNSTEFLKAIEENPSAIYATFSTETLPIRDILSIDSNANKYECCEISTIEGYKLLTLQRVKSLFDSALERDKNWLYSFSSKVVLSIKNIQDINKILFVDYLYKKQPDENYVLLFNDRKIERLFLSIIDNRVVSERLVLPSFKACGRIVRTLLRVLLNKPNTIHYQVVFYSLSTGIPVNNSDTYFGDLPVHVSKKLQSTLVYSASGNKLRLPRTDKQIPIESFVSWRNVASAVYETLSECLFRQQRPRPPSESSLNHNIISYLKESELRTGEFFMLRLYKKAFSQMCEKLNPETLIFPFENRSWEKLLVLAARKKKIGKLIGYQHSSLTNRHLAFEIPETEIAEGYLPDSIITVGNITAEHLRNLSPLYQDKLLIAGSLRRVEVVGHHSLPDASILIAISSSFSEALRLLLHINQYESHINIPVIIRSHPTIPIKELFDSFNWPSNISLSEGRTLTEDILSVSLVGYSSSTVSLEGMLYGRLPVFIDIGDVPAGDPILGSCRIKYTVNQEKDLLKIINEYNSLNKQNRSNLSKQAISYAESYLQKVDKDKYEMIVNHIAELKNTKSHHEKNEPLKTKFN
ncbi:MAG: hypothetical protein GQ527_06830 [Bacteroidales bacterium]|nr:hypothetical protein [Bacteroidales bacterium]